MENADFLNSDRPTGTGGSAPTESGDLERLLRHFSELAEHLAHYLNAKADSLRLTARGALFRVELKIVGILATAGAIVAGVTLVFIGAAGGLTRLFGDRSWLGELSAGLLLLGCVSLIVCGYRILWLRD